MTKTAEDLREYLFATIAAVRDGKIELDKAMMIAELSREITALAKVEVDHARVTQGRGSRFLSAGNDTPAPPAPGNGILGVRRHLLKDE